MQAVDLIQWSLREWQASEDGGPKGRRMSPVTGRACCHQEQIERMPFGVL
jgi:hypothetical protein